MKCPYCKSPAIEKVAENYMGNEEYLCRGCMSKWTINTAFVS